GQGTAAQAAGSVGRDRQGAEEPHPGAGRQAQGGPGQGPRRRGVALAQDRPRGAGQGGAVPRAGAAVRGTGGESARCGRHPAGRAGGAAGSAVAGVAGPRGAGARRPVTVDARGPGVPGPSSSVQSTRDHAVRSQAPASSSIATTAITMPMPGPEPTSPDAPADCCDQMPSTPSTVAMQLPTALTQASHQRRASNVSAEATMPAPVEV